MISIGVTSFLTSQASDLWKSNKHRGKQRQDLSPPGAGAGPRAPASLQTSPLPGPAGPARWEESATGRRLTRVRLLTKLEGTRTTETETPASRPRRTSSPRSVAYTSPGHSTAESPRPRAPSPGGARPRPAASPGHAPPG